MRKNILESIDDANAELTSIDDANSELESIVTANDTLKKKKMASKFLQKLRNLFHRNRPMGNHSKRVVYKAIRVKVR